MAQLKRMNMATGGAEDQWGFGDDPGLVGAPQQMGEEPLDRTPPSLSDKYPGISDPFMGRDSEGPRFGDAGRGDEGPRAALRKPGSSPQPSAGNSFQASSGGMGAPQMGVQPFNPLPQAPIGSFAQSRQGGLYGSLGGLKGGGLGVPQDATPDAASDPINTLIKLLMGGGQG